MVDKVAFAEVFAQVLGFTEVGVVNAKEGQVIAILRVETALIL